MLTRFPTFIAAILLTLAGMNGCRSNRDEPPDEVALPQAPEPASKLYPIQHGGKWGYIDARGRVVVLPRYDAAWSFQYGRALVWKDSKALILNEAGQPIAESPFTHDHTPFSEEFAEG